MSTRTLFDTPVAVQALTRASETLMAFTDDSVRFRLGQMLKIMARSPSLFDQNCQVNIEWIGNSLLERVTQIATNPDNSNIELLSAIVYRFYVEYDLTVRDELNFEIRAFLRDVIENVNHFSSEAREQVIYARQEMPIAITKRILNSVELGSLRDVSAVALKIENKIEGWHEDLEDSEKQATALGDLFKKHSQAFNFVGLHDAFLDLSTQVKKELFQARCGIWAFGILLVMPSLIELALVLTEKIDFTLLSTRMLIALALGSISATLLFLYFFRISLRKADSCRAQLMQIQLRMSLCRFIQSYSEYAKTMKEQSGETLAKFEALIFSGIVGTEEKLPSTFDGIEQITAIAKAIKAK